MKDNVFLKHPPIEHFSGVYNWLSNFYRVDVCLDNITYSSVEHAYQAAKTINADEREMIRNASTAGKAKKLGRGVEQRKDWTNIRLDVMLDLLRQKFKDPDLKAKLLNTADALLVEGNWWKDYFWGVCNGIGSNHLGRLLMKVREELK